MIRPPSISTLFPYTTLFRSQPHHVDEGRDHQDHELALAPLLPRLGRGHRSFYSITRSSSCPVPRAARPVRPRQPRSEEHTSELQSRQYLVCRLLLEKKKIS